MKMVNLFSASVMILTVFASTANADSLIVDGSVEPTLTITHDQFKGLPRTDLQLDGPNGIILKYSGVDFVQLLMKAGVPTGHALKGKDADKYVVASGKDGFAAVFSLSELDHGAILIADELDGLPLSVSDGPFRVISPNDGRRSRWVRQLVRISVRKALP